MNFSRREFIGIAAATSLQGATAHPNVVLILTDDQGYGDLSCHGNTVVKTPNIDRLATQSTEFTRFTVSPVCAPTRAALLTGRYPMRCGVHGVTAGRETMRSNEITLGRAFQAAGYKTALFGKWHLGENYPHVPHAMGFDEFVGFRLGHWNRYFNSPTERNGKPLRLDGYVTDALTDHGLRFLDDNRDRPFFLYLPLNAPHAPYQVPDKYFSRFAGSGLPAEVAATYAMVENIDDNVGRVMARLDALKIASNTIVIFMCDNGPQTERYVSGLRGRKGAVYEGGTRSPFFIRWPGHIPAGKRVDRIAAHIDVFPTLMELCGVKPPPGPKVDGISLTPEFAGGALPERLIFSHNDHQPDPTKPYPGAARSQRFKMVNGDELYDLIADPAESKNVAAAHPDELKRLNRAYEEWFRSTLVGFKTGHPPIPVGYAEENPAVLSAPQAKLEGGLRFFAKNGFANDFIAGWTELAAKATWEIAVHAGGRYELSIEYLCASEDVGAQLEMSSGANSIEARISEGGSLKPNPLPERSSERQANTAPDLNWKMLRVGRMTLEPGVRTIEVRAMSKPGKEAMYLKSVQVRRLL